MASGLKGAIARLRDVFTSGTDGREPVSYTHLTLPTNSRV